MEDDINCEEYIKKFMGEKRYTHSVNVAKCAVQIAEQYNIDKDKIYKAGILHDIAKEMPREKQIELIDMAKIQLDDVEEKAHKLWHAIAGSVYVSKFVTDDKDIVSAIRYHTTGKKNMSLYEQILYVADYISDDREFSEVGELRKALYDKGLDVCTLKCLQYGIFEIMNMGKMVHTDTFEAYNMYADKINKDS